MSSPQNPQFTVWESIGRGIHNSRGISQIFADWTPPEDPPSTMPPPSRDQTDALREEIANLRDQIRVFSKALSDQELELKELRDQREDSLTRPIFKRTMPQR